MNMTRLRQLLLAKRWLPALSIALCVMAPVAFGQLADLADVPLVTARGGAKPNLMFILDDSGSMASDFMPDFVEGQDHCKQDSGGSRRCRKAEGEGDPPYQSADFNAIYYNPEFDYRPGVSATNVDLSHNVNTTLLAQAPSTWTTASHPWNAIYTDPYLGTATFNLRMHFEEVVYCSASGPGNTYSTTTDLPADCMRNGFDVYPIPGLTGASNFTSARQWRATATGNPPYETVWCTAATAAGPFTEATLRNTCRRQLNGYVFPGTIATSTTTNVTYNRRNVFRPAAPFYYRISSVQWCNSATNAAATTPPAGTCKARKDATYAFVRYGTFTRVNISNVNGTYPAGTGRTRTYVQEMSNFATWFSFYRTRMLMMKTGAGRAFGSVDDKFRLGFLTINQSGSDSNKYLKIDTATPAHRSSWYSKFYAQTPGSGTPLRSALSRAGRMYAGKTLDDPVQGWCQQNYTFLSTDGFWNGSAGYDINGNAVGNQDNVDSGATAKPKWDGNLLPTTSAGSSAGGKDTLADVAMYYYKTDIRDPSFSNCNVTVGGTSQDVCDNPDPSPTANHDPQRMTTFTIGLGVDGTLGYTSNYAEQTPGSDYTQIVNGSKFWPSPKQNDETAIDDLWHAAVNGNGSYYSAKNPRSLVQGLSDALLAVSSDSGNSSAAATSNPNVIAGDNYVFSTQFRTGFWDGRLYRSSLNLRDGKLSAADWSAELLLDTRVSASSDTRNIYAFDPASATKMKEFVWGNLTATEQSYFSSGIPLLTQYSTLSAADQSAATGASLVKFLRGQWGDEEQSSNTNQLYRDRDHVLGDIVNAEAAYVRGAMFEYADAGYSQFKTDTRRDRRPTVYAAANDGMLHAFDATTGAELWAFVPTMVMPNMYKLADRTYSHAFYVDGTPTVADIKVSGAWKTILVGGLNKGGRGYYALDITDPDAPRALWQFSTANDPNIGFTYGNPVVTKLANGTWVALFSSGYNNVSPGDGKGYLYVVNAYTGELIKKIGTGAGSTSTPTGLGRLAPWVEDFTDNTAARVYGGDLAGNLWRFDINNDAAPMVQVTRLTGPTSGAVSITSRPELGKIDGKPVVFVGTGRMLGLSDLANTSVQSFFAIKDDWTVTSSPVYSASSLRSQLVQQTFVTAGKTRTSPTTAPEVDWAAKAGWYIDLADAGERSYTDPLLVAGTIVFTTNVPQVGVSTAVCAGGDGTSWTYYLDYRRGTAIGDADASSSGGPPAAAVRGDAFYTKVVGVSVGGKLQGLTNDSTGRTHVNRIPISRKAKGNQANWRELIIDQ